MPATGILRTLQGGEQATRLAQGIAEFGRIDKTIHALTFVDDEDKRRGTLVQLKRGEGRYRLSRVVFHGKRGELRQHYREGQDDQLGALGRVVSIIVLWNTLYMQAALERLRTEGFPVLDAVPPFLTASPRFWSLAQELGAPTTDGRDQAQPSSFKASPEFQILVMCAILSPLNCIT